MHVFNIHELLCLSLSNVISNMKAAVRHVLVINVHG